MMYPYDQNDVETRPWCLSSKYCLDYGLCLVLNGVCLLPGLETRKVLLIAGTPRSSVACLTWWVLHYMFALKDLEAASLSRRRNIYLVRDEAGLTIRKGRVYCYRFF